MKKIYLLCLAILVIAITSMMLTGKNNSKQTKSPILEENQPLFQKGMITIKVNEGIKDIMKQQGIVSFNIPSLDSKANKFEVDLLDKRFKYNAKKLKKGLPDLSRIYRISFPEKYPVKKVAEEFASDSNIEYAEPIPVDKPTDVPDDELYDQCQHLPQIFAPQAWGIHHGEDGPEIVIAIIDNGVYWKHIDLTDNIWQNLGEDFDGDGKTLEFIGGEWVFDPDDINDFDDDGNGFADDFIGWDMVADDNDPDHNSGEDHGTHCSGIAAGMTNNEVGIASISWNVKTMPIQVANPEGSFVGAYDGIIYAAENGADFISNSWGGLLYSLANQEVINYVAGLGSIVVAAAHNYNNEIPIYPASYLNAISVASLSVDDTKASYSNYGAMIDISAPGGGWEGGILSTTPFNNYDMMSGTSMACPLVAGCFGLLKSYYPNWTNEQLITQMMGTVDNIDAINPDYQYLLGTGRVNAFNMLVEENVIMPQEFKLDLISADPQDENGNDINEPGEEVTLNFEFRNYVPYVDENDVTVTIQSYDPEITILEGTAIIDIPPDGFFTIEEQFQIQVDEEAISHFVDFTIHFETTSPVVYGQDMNFKLLVAPSGIFVFEGEENGQDYSGSYIKIFLEHLGFETTYSNTYPATLRGFETVFLSHGNFGEALDHGYMFAEEHSLMFQEFLEDGGNMFVEMGTMIGAIDYGSYSNGSEIKALFGVQSNTINFTNNPIDSLYGIEGSVMEDIYFTQSTQFNTWYIDDLIAAPGAIVPFYENAYGNVSIMNDGSSSYGHKALYFGYALAELKDLSTINSRYNVLLKIMEFFEHELPEAYVLSNFISDKNVGGSPLEVQFTDISLSAPGYQINSWQWDFDNDGIIDSDEQNPTWTYNDGGSYDVVLISSNGSNTDTLLLENYITVNHGFLVYEGVSDGTCYSGAFIRDYLTENNYAVSYENTFPENLEGFGAVFLSFGNYGIENTVLNSQMASTIIEYLDEGGYVYLEGGDALGFDQAGNNTLLNLFGLASVSDGTTNNIDSLAGQPDAITNEMLFTSSSQLSNTYIDIFNPQGNADNAFIESNYGAVAVQYTGDKFQRTFCFSYALADIDDATFPNTREELMNRICDFFDIYTDINMPDGLGVEFTVFPNPVANQTNISFSIPFASTAEIKIYTINGQLISTLSEKTQKGEKQVLVFDATGFPAGIYFCTLKTKDGIQTRKIIKL